MRRSRLLVTVLAVVPVIVVGGLLFRSTSTGAASLEQTETVEVVRGSLGTKVSATGFISPERRVPVVVDSRERVVSVDVVAGQQVVRGQVLITLDSASARRDVERDQLALRRAELAVASAALSRPCTNPDSTGCLAFRTRELELQEARLDLRDAKKQFSDLTVRAPVAGLVVDVRIGHGELAGNPAAPAIVLAASSEWQVEVEADEFEIRDIAVGQKVSTLVPALTETPCLGHVTSAPAILRARMGIGAPTLFRFAASLNCPIQPTVAGLSAHVEVETSSVRDAVLAPLRALFREGDHDYVVVMKHRRPQSQRVSLGITDASMAQILSGLAAGDYVLAGDPNVLRLIANRGR